MIGLLGGAAFASTKTLGALNSERKMGVALVGLGNYSEGELGPALLKSKRAQLTGLVSGSPGKIPKWREKYGVPEENVYSYENFDEIAGNKEIDIIYVVLPPGLHAEYCIRAAKAGKHVICEKPMAATAAECDAMIAAAKEAGVSLHVGYRLHWDPYHLRMMEVAEKKELGEPTSIETALSFVNRNPDPKSWKMSKKLGIAGELYNLGTYPIQAAIYIARQNPIRITATSHNARPDIFIETAEGYDWEMEFPSGLKAKCFASAAKNGNFLKVAAANGKFELDRAAFAYRGLSGHVNGVKMEFPEVNQQALQIDGICEAIAKGEKGKVPGEMGRRDTAILEAIVKSAETGKPVELADLGYGPF